MKHYRILIVDDEKIIRDGIAGTVDWDGLGVRLVGTAADGQEAYETIVATRPDIVLTDIIMPAMNGIELIQKVTHELRDVKFIVLSGFDEFEFAREAMICGVQQYLLKPTSEEEIGAAVRQVVLELNAEDERQALVTELSAELESIQPELRRQFLRDCIAERHFPDELRQQRMRMLSIPDRSLRLLILRPVDFAEPTAIPTLEKIFVHVFGEQDLFCTYTMDSLVCVVHCAVHNELNTGIREVQHLYRLRNGKDVTTSISREGQFMEINILHTEARELLEYEFLFGQGSLLKADEINLGTDRQRQSTEPYFGSVIQAVRSGDVDCIRKNVEEISRSLLSSFYDRPKILNYFTRQLLELYWAGDSLQFEHVLDALASIRSCDQMEELVDTVAESAIELARTNEARIGRINNALVRRVMQSLEEHLADEFLSVKWLTENEVFAHADYLSRLFKRETGRRFSEVLTERRIEAACKLLRDQPAHRISEVAALTGFGANAQYFSQVFKRIVGMTPSEYRDSHHNTPS